MARYTQDSIERLRETADIVTLVSRKTDLRRVGTRFTGLCPFHDERTPSFSVDSERGLYHCFGCGQGGDAIRFVMETENLDFPQAVEQLAEDNNVELKRDREDPQEEERRRRRERLLALLERTAGFYAAFLGTAGEARRARDYLRERGLSDEVLAAFRVGYAPKAWDRVLTAARRDGYSEEELLGAGLSVRGRNGGIYDRFRERITFPLADARGRVLGFGARAMRDDQGAKYINTAEGEIYHKGRQLFGIDLARSAVAKAGRVIVVEGYTDVLALHQAGFEETVGIMGTAFTAEQLGELARVVGGEGTVYLALDADRSGQEAMLRAARMAEERSVALRVVTLPEGKDPAELVSELGTQAVTERIESALSVLEFSVGRVLAEGDLGNPEGRDRALNAARDLIGTAPRRSASRDHLVRLVADRLDVPAHYVEADLQTSRAPRRESPGLPAVEGDPGPEQSQTPRATRPPATVEPETRHLAVCLAAGVSGREELERLEPGHLTSDLMRRVREHLLAHFDDPLDGIAPDDHELAALISGIALRAEEVRPVEPLALTTGHLQLELRSIERQMRRARHEEGLDLGALAAKAQRVKDAMRDAMGSAS